MLLVAGGVIFVGVASVIKPTPRDAAASPGGAEMDQFALELRDAFSEPINVNSNDPQERALVERLKQRSAAANAAQHPKGWKLLGMLEGREHLVKCWASPEGPRYSVFTLDGRLLQADLPADEVYRGFPDIDLLNLRADPPGAEPAAPSGTTKPNGGLVDFVDVWRE